MNSAQRHSGFTLIELAVVVLIIGILGAVAIPQFIPIIMFSQLEGTARHLGNYGNGAIAHATLMRENVTVRIDFDNQQYYAVRWVVPDEEGEAEDEGEMPDQLALLNEFRRSGEFGATELSGMLAEGKNLPDDFDAELADLQMNDRFAKWQKNIILSRAKNVVHDESFLDDIGNFVDEVNFSLEEEAEPIEEELMDPVLERSTPLGDAYIEAVLIDGEKFDSGVAEITLSPLGLESNARFYVTDGYEYYTVDWNAVAGTANVMLGKVEDDS